MPPMDPDHAPNGAKLMFSAPGWPPLAGAGPGTALDPVVTGCRADFKRAKEAPRTPLGVIWHRPLLPPIFEVFFAFYENALFSRPIWPNRQKNVKPGVAKYSKWTPSFGQPGGVPCGKVVILSYSASSGYKVAKNERVVMIRQRAPSKIIF